MKFIVPGSKTHPPGKTDVHRRALLSRADVAA